MTKKKLTAIVLLGSFMMFICATFINYFSALADMLEDIRQNYKSTYSDEMIVDYIEGRIEDIESLHRNILGYTPDSTNTKPAYAFALVDKNKNVLFKSENGLWWSVYDEKTNQSSMNYASIEEYMTSEVKSEIMKFKIQSGHGNILIHEINLHTDGEKKIPVSIVLGDQKGGYMTVKLNDLEINETVNREKNRYLILSWNFYDLDENSIDHKYYQKAMTKLENAISEYEYNGNDGGHGFFSSGEFNRCSVIDGYAFFMYVEYSPFHKIITSEFFWALTFYTAIIFAVATLIVYIVAIRLFNKSQQMRRNQQAFISAAAHELKTPLAVIQNQCECIMENIAPEKNGEYVKSVYDEAVRMDSIVRTLLLFNRVTNAESVLKERCDLSEIVKAEIEKYRAYAKTNNAEISCDIKDGVFVSANHELISLAIDNYFSNAVKYAKGEKKISVRLDANAKEFVFEVYNDGDAIPCTEDIWGILTKGDSARTSSGDSSGMGLPINKRIFELHGFGCSYTNKRGGVSFFFKGKTIK